MSYQSNMAGVTLLPKGSKPIAPKQGENGKQPARDERRPLGNPKIWGVKCRSDVNGNPKNLNVERNFRPRADRRHDGTETAKISIATCETIARSYGVARLCAKTRRNFENLCLTRGEPFAISKLREWGDKGTLR